MQLPHSVEAEEALLGAVIINGSIIDKIDLMPEEFYIDANGLIFSVIRSLGMDADIVSIIEVLERRNKLDYVGGQSYITGLMNKCPATYNYETYQRIIRDTATRRKVIINAEELAKSAFDENTNIEEVISSGVSGLVSSVKSSSGAEHISKYLGELCDLAEERAANPKTIYGLPTGLRDFDRITYGLQRQESTILAGPPGTGKSLLAFQLACGMAENGYSGVVYELEMTGIAVVRRRISALSKIKTYNINSGIDMDKGWTEFIAAIDKMATLPIFISEESNFTTMQMRADLARLKAKEDISWFIVDYMGLLSDRSNDNELDRLKYISHSLKAIAKDLNLAGLVLQSVNKEGYSNPSMANVSGPTAIHHDADQIIVMSSGIPDNKNLQNVVTLTWEKMRESDNDRILSLYKQPGLPVFSEYTTEEQEVWWQK